MTRRKKRARTGTVWVDWTPDHAGLFLTVIEGWTPPARVKLQGTLNRLTVTARFVTPDGATPTAFVRLRKGDAGYDIVDQGFRVSFTSRGAR